MCHFDPVVAYLKQEQQRIGDIFIINYFTADVTSDEVSQLAERFLGLPILLARSWVRSPVRSVNLWAEIPNSLTKRTSSSSQCGSPGGLGESPGLAGVLRGSLYPRPEATSTF